MFTCPKCNVPLARGTGSTGLYWACPSCQGRSATIGLLRRLIPRDTVNVMWQVARAGDHPKKRLCPACGRMMEEVPVPCKSGMEYLDVCVSCQFVWFDSTEYDALPGKPSVPAAGGSLPQEAREKLALLELDKVRESAEERWGDGSPDEFWKYIPALFGMPIESDAPSLQHRPWLTWLLTLVISAVSVLAFFDLKNTVNQFGLIPSQFGRYGGLTLITAFFLHGGVFHLLSNMYFFLIFGDNVEDVLGKWRFLALLLAADLAGNLLHILGAASSTIPCVGASGGISGIIAYYALKFPHARLGFLFRFYLLFKWVHMPAYAMFILWVGLQFVGTFMQLSGFSNVSALAHLGGAVMGLVFWVLTRKE